MKERELNTAIKFNIVEECKKLETELLQIDRVAEVEFDLDGFYDNMNQVIVLTKYDVPVGMENYFQKRREIIMNVIETARKNFLIRTEDNIEDYGEHFYFVFHCGKEWNK